MTTPSSSHDFLSAGTFTIGANYWASHSGPGMWRDWNPKIVKEDFQLLAGKGIKLLRIFPLWPDFQPIHQLRTALGNPMEIRQGEIALPSGTMGQSGVSFEMLDRFRQVLDLAAGEGIGLVVGLITGWMSGRLYVPPALEGLNPITDPRSLLWQLRLVKTLVGQCKDHSAIKAWDLGNECNVMGQASREQAYLWTAAIADAIRSSDFSRPVISGMHSLAVEPGKPWPIADQGELADLLTTHPYPLFTPHCNREPMNSMRPLLHSTAESCLYADLSGKPCFVEEIGNFGPYFCPEKNGAEMMRTILASLWAHDNRAALWWCAFDQLSLTQAPHAWVTLERELGLFRESGEAKPLVAEMTAFIEKLGTLPFAALPPRRIEAVCLLSAGQDQWGAAYSAFVLAKQAGFDVRFHYLDVPLPEAELYLLPSLGGLIALPRERELELQEKVAGGATLYLSVDDGFIREGFAMTGLEFAGRWSRSGACRFDYDGESFSLGSSTRFNFKDGQAQILGRDSNGCPVFSSNAYGRGRIYFLSLPLETQLATQNEAFLGPQASSWWKLYRQAAADCLSRRLLKKHHPALGITEHRVNGNSGWVVLINYSAEEIEDNIHCLNGNKFVRSLYGAAPLQSLEGIHLSLPAHGWALWEIGA